MSLGDSGEALRAKAALARRHAEELRVAAQHQRERAREQLEAEARAVDAAREGIEFEGPLLSCARCSAIWRTEAIAEATRRHPVCLLCGGPLVPVP